MDVDQARRHRSGRWASTMVVDAFGVSTSLARLIRADLPFSATGISIRIGIGCFPGPREATRA